MRALVSIAVSATLLAACDRSDRPADPTPASPRDAGTAGTDATRDSGTAGTAGLPTDATRDAGTAGPPTDATRVRQVDGATMLLVPEGPFLRGSRPDEGQPDERPQRSITLSAFFIDRTEVTAAQYRKCRDAGACPAPATDRYCTLTTPGRDQHPINCVAWSHADAYCRWAGVRLPTEAEWEKAARGTDGEPYPWGPTPATCVVAVRFDKTRKHACGKFGTWPVGSKPFGKSPYGALDMGGNVWEWVADWYDANGYATSSDRDPKGPAEGRFRILRGGGWGNDGEGSLRSARRFKFSPENQTPGIGFRCALSVR